MEKKYCGKEQFICLQVLQLLCQMPLLDGKHGALQNCKNIRILRSQYWTRYAASTKQRQNDELSGKRDF